jgi:four helix bundle protein
MRNYKQSKICQKGFEIAVDSLQLINSFPKVEISGWPSSLKKDTASLLLPNAGGSSRNNLQDYNSFLEIALGSAYEVETHLLIAGAINLGKKELTEKLLNNAGKEQKQIMSLMKKIFP